MKHLFLLLFLMAALFHGTPSLCDTAKDDDAEELKQAVEPIKKAAEQGDITAQYKRMSGMFFDFFLSVVSSSHETDRLSRCA